MIRWGRPVTTDRYVSMDRGPVLSHVLDLINQGPAPGTESVWDRYISEPKGYEIQLREEASTDELSRAEIHLIEEIFRQYGHMSRWELVDLVHQLPEWQDPEGGAVPIGYADILKASGKSPDEIEAILGELDNVAAVESLRPA